MSDEDKSFIDRIAYWFKTPDPDEDDHDDIWHHEEIFSGDWVEIQNRAEWYESPNVVTVYKDHKYILDQNMEMGKPDETFYFQNVDSREFKSVMEVKEDLPGGWGELMLQITPKTKSPPSEDNDFAMMEYFVSLKIRYDLPPGVKFLPRIIARPLNSFFQRVFEKYVLEEVLEYDIEYARERLIEYYDYIRKYHGEEPIQTKSRQTAYHPMDEHRFFE